MNPEQWLSLKWNGGSTMSDRWLNQSKIIHDPLINVFGGWLPFKRSNQTWNIDALYNIFLLTPLTFFLGKSFPHITKKNLFKKMILISFGISFFIEINQLIFAIGTFQVSDLVYNTISGVIGGVIYKMSYKITSENLSSQGP